MERTICRYSTAFKMQVMEEIRDGKWTSATQAGTMYGIHPKVIYHWMDRLGFSHLKRRIVVVKTPKEIDEIKELKKQIKELKEALVNEVVSHAIDAATLQVAAQKLDVTVEELKKKAGK